MLEEFVQNGEEKIEETQFKRNRKVETMPVILGYEPLVKSQKTVFF